MRYPKSILSLTLLVGLTLNISHSQPLKPAVQGPQPSTAPAAAPEPIPTFEIDKKTSKRAHLDFSLNPKPISDPSLKLSNFANRKLLIFYFSAKCPHCQHAFPFIQKLADELAGQGFASLTIAIKYNEVEDIRGFVKDYQDHLPVMHDEDKTFGENYGTGSIPLIILVNEKGEYIRYKTFDAESTPLLIKTAASQFSQKG